MGTTNRLRPAARRTRSAGPVLLLASLAACAVQHVRFTREGGNPPFAAAEQSYPQDGVQDPLHPDLLRISFDRHGDPYPDPLETQLDDVILARGGHSVRAYFESISQGYDPEAVARGLARRIEAACGAGESLVILIHGVNNSYPEARRFHDLRHSCASGLVMKSVPLKTVQVILGHKSFVTTLRSAHLAPELRQEAVERLCEPASGHFLDTQAPPSPGPTLRPAANDGVSRGSSESGGVRTHDPRLKKPLLYL